MPQTETLLLILLGFSLAALIFLFAARLLWSMAIRLGARRMQRQVPSTVADLQSERDRLRAEYAKISQKLSARLESLRMQMAEHMSEVTRNRNRIEALVHDLNGRDEMLAARDRDLEAQGHKLGQAEEDVKALRQEVRALTLELARKDRELSGALAGWSPARDETAILLPAPEPAAAGADAPTSDERLRQRIEKLAALSQQMAETRNAELPAADAPMVDKFAEAARETEDLQKELAKLDAAWNSVPDAAAAPAEVQPGSEAPRAVANVVSLANRLRSLQKGFVK